MAKQNLMSVKQYAKACGVTRTVIYRRIEDGEIVPIVQSVYGGQPTTLIDAAKFPFVMSKGVGRPTTKGKKTRLAEHQN